MMPPEPSPDLLYSADEMLEYGKACRDPALLNEPVAQVALDDENHIYWFVGHEHHGCGTLLYAAPKDVNSTHTHESPPGYVLVPEVPTEAMIEKGERLYRSFGETYPANPDAKCKCEHWQFCKECHPTAGEA